MPIAKLKRNQGQESAADGIGVMMSETVAYHDDTSELTKTALTVFCDSAREYYLQFVTKEMERRATTKQMAVGTALHGMLLERKKLEEVVGIYPASCLRSDGAINWKPAAQYRADNPDKVVFCKQAEAEDIQIVYDAVKDSAIATAIEECSHFEKQFSARVHGVPCKCKPDIAGDVGDYWMLYDLKFMERIHPAQFRRSAKGFKYWLQDAHYSAVISEITGKPTVFKFLAVETQYPYRVHAYWYGHRQREIARDFHAKKLGEFAECQRTDTWVDKWPNELDLNPWDVGLDVSDEEVLDWEDEGVSA